MGHMANAAPASLHAALQAIVPRRLAMRAREGSRLWLDAPALGIEYLGQLVDARPTQSSPVTLASWCTDHHDVTILW